MKFIKKFNLFFIVILAFSIIGCNNDNSDAPQQGTSRITVKLVDDPGDFDNVFVEIVDVMIKMNDETDGDDNWQSLNAINPGVYDLLTLTGGVNLLLVNDFEVLAGELNQIRLILGDDNSVVIDGETFPLNTPSAQQSGLKVHVDQTLLPGIGYTFILDFDADESIVIAGNSGNINLHPVLRASFEATTGTISGSINPFDVQTEITATNGIDTISTFADADGNFLLVGLTPGFYTITATPDPLSLLDAAVIDNVEVTLENDTDLGIIDL